MNLKLINPYPKTILNLLRYYSSAKDNHFNVHQMNRIAIFFLLGLALFATPLYCQVDVFIDPTFGTNGNTEVNLEGHSNSVVGLSALPGSPITVGVKVGTTEPGFYKIGIIRTDTGGHFDPNFGTGLPGITVASWGINDVPYDMHIQWDIDSTILFCGIARVVPHLYPAIYKFKKNGVPDSSFGADGRLIVPFDEVSEGEADNVFSGYPGYVVLGKNYGTGTGLPGFGVIYLTKEGLPDTSEGPARFVVPALVHSVHGFNLTNRTFFFCGISDTGKPEILACHIILDDSGRHKIDTSISRSGIIHTGVFLPYGNSIMARHRPTDGKIIVLLPSPPVSPTPVTLCRFWENGTLDSTYGNNGIDSNIISPSIEVQGMNPSNDNSTFVSGRAGSGTGISITARLNDTTAAPDPKYFPHGIAMLDIDGGAHSNSLNYVNPVGKASQIGNIKRYVGTGISNHDGTDNVMLTRFQTAPSNGVDDMEIPINDILNVYPNPASSQFKITSSLPKSEIRIVDALGREILQALSGKSDEATAWTFNASQFSNGMYYCMMRSGTVKAVRKFIVSH